MKKTLLLTVLILSFVFSVVSHAAVTDVTGGALPSPDVFWNNGNQINSGGTFDAGTLPRMKAPTIVRPMPTLNAGIRLLSDSEEGASATAEPESENSSNVIFKLSGIGNAGLIDRAIVAKTGTGAGVLDTTKIGPVRRHEAKVKLSTVSEGTTGMFVMSTGAITVLTLNDSGVYLSNGGAYINNAVSGEKVWFVSPETMSADTWYIVETVVEILDAGYVTQDARIYAADGTLVGRSGYYRVEDDATLTATSGVCQIYTKDFGSGYAMIDDWNSCVVTGTTKASFTTDFSDNTASRKVYKLVSDTALDADSVSTDAVKLTSTTVDMTGKYTVSYDSATQAIVVTASDSLPYNTNFVIQLAAEKMLASADKYLALDYSNATLEYSFTTPLDPFDISSINYDPATGTATVNVQNNDAVPRDCMVIVASFGADDEYMGTRCGFANVSNVAGSNTATITVTGIEKAAGGRVSVMIWDNWKTMSSIGNMHTVNISAE